MNTRSLPLATLALLPLPVLAAETGESPQEAFLEERRALYEERNAIVESHSEDSGAVRRRALEDWRDENRERFEALREVAKSLSRANEERAYGREALANRISELETTEIPDRVSPARRAFLEKRREWLLEKLAKEKELAGLAPAARREAMREWRQKAPEKPEALRALAEAAAAESASKPRNAEVPGEPYLPEGVSDEERAFLVKRHELYRDRVAIQRDNADRSPGERRAALEQWRRERTKDFDEMRSLAEKVSENRHAN